jgi:hypothetical protein
MYNAAMKKGGLKEENVAKISITAKRARDEKDYEELIKLVKLMTKKRRMKIN